jgi:type I restriction enzyme M protein
MKSKESPGGFWTGGISNPLEVIEQITCLLFTKTNSGGTDHVWFYDVDADGMSLNDKRTELLPPEKLGAVPRVALTADEHSKNNLPDILARWQERAGSETKRPKTAQSFVIRKLEIRITTSRSTATRKSSTRKSHIDHRARSSKPSANWRPRYSGA